MSQATSPSAHTLTPADRQPDPTLDPIASQIEAARVLGISVDTLRNLRKTGKLKAVQVSARRVGVRHSELNRYIREQKARA